MHKKGTFIFLNHCFHSQPKDIAGQLATLFVICLAVLLIFIAVVVNLSKFISQKTRLTIAADSSALLLGSMMGSYAYKLSKEGCNGGLHGKWYRSYGLFFKILATIVAIVLIIVAAILEVISLGLGTYIAIALVAVAGICLAVWSECYQDPKQVRMINKQLAKVPEKYRYSEIAIQNAFALTINDPNMAVDTYDYNKDGSTTDKISAFMKWQYERLEELIEGNDIANNNQSAQKLASLYALTDVFEAAFIPRARDFGGYLDPEFKTTLTALKTEDEINSNIALSTQFFEQPPSFVSDEVDEDEDEEGPPLNRIDYLIQDITDITGPETIQSLLDLLHSPLSLESESGWLAVESLLETLNQEWSSWITDLNQWLEKENEMKSAINNRLNDIEVRIGQINQLLACKCCSYTVCDDYGDCQAIDDPACQNGGMPAISAEKAVLESEKQRLNNLLPLIDAAITKINEFKNDGLTPFIQALGPLIGESSAPVPGRQINYSWNDSLGSHYVQVTVSGGWGIPYTQIKRVSRWYGNKKRLELHDYHGKATVTVERFDQPQQLSFGSGLPLWNFRYAKQLSGFGKYSAAAEVEWGVYTSSWHLPRLIKVK